MTIQNLTAQLEAARAAINAPALAILKTEHATASKEYDRLDELFKSDPVTDRANERAAAKNRKSHAAAALDKLNREIAQARDDAARLTRLLDSGVTLATARQSWRVAADAQVNATKEAQDAQDAMTALNDVLVTEQEKAQAANALQRAATLAELGFGPKVDTTAAAAGKLLDTANLKIDALKNDATPAAQRRIDRANTALVQADLATRAAERAIVQAHADCAELAYAVASEAFEAVLLNYHATQIAAHGTMGLKADFYRVLNDPRFDDAAERIKANSERGE